MWPIRTSLRTYRNLDLTRVYYLSIAHPTELHWCKITHLRVFSLPKNFPIQQARQIGPYESTGWFRDILVHAWGQLVLEILLSRSIASCVWTATILTLLLAKGPWPCALTAVLNILTKATLTCSFSIGAIHHRLPKHQCAKSPSTEDTHKCLLSLNFVQCFLSLLITSRMLSSGLGLWLGRLHNRRPISRIANILGSRLL